MNKEDKVVKLKLLLSDFKPKELLPMKPSEALEKGASMIRPHYTNFLSCGRKKYDKENVGNLFEARQLKDMI